MRILFEVDSLEQASPATVSRCGMVFLTEETVSWKLIIDSYIAAIKKKKLFTEE